MDMPSLSLVHKFGRAPSLFDPRHVNDLLALASSPRNAEITAETEKNCAAGFWESNFGTNGKSFIFAGGMAVIPVYGALVHRDNWCTPWATGYDYISSRLAAAVGDDEVTAVVLDINSPGGHVMGNFELSRMIAELRERKPIYALVDGNAKSGSYSIASAATRIYATSSAEIGSIGVMMAHMSYQEALEKNGVKVSLIYAGEHKVDGNPYEDLPDDVRKDLQKSCQRSYDAFVALVAENRGIDPDVVRGTQARVLEADEALTLGLIDEVMPPRAAYAAIQQELRNGSATTTNGAKSMSTDTPNQGAEGAAVQQQIAEASANARKEATARIGAILSCEEAAARPKLAHHLAMNTEMSADDAKKMLAVAAAETPTAEASAPAPGNGPLAAAMAGQNGLTAGVDGAKPDSDEPSAADKRAAVVARVTGNHRSATGIKPATH